MDRERQVLTGRLRCRIAPAVDRRASEDAVIVFRPWDLGILAEDLARRRQHKSCPCFARGVQHISGARDVYIQNIKRIAHVFAHSNHGCKVEDQVTAGDTIADIRGIPDVPGVEREMWLFVCIPAIWRPLIHRDDFMFVKEEGL